MKLPIVLGEIGANMDLPPYDMPPQAFSEGTNVRFRDGAIERFQGQAPIFSTPLGAPYRLIPIQAGVSYYWVYAGINRIWATDSVAHADVSPAVGSYSATAALGWNGSAFQGHVVMTEGRQPPLTWTPDLANDFVVVPAWDPTLIAEIIRPYRNYLIAMRCIETGLTNKRLMRWSNSANPGQMPTSWDWTDPTNDAGRLEFGATEDDLVDGLTMRDTFVVYKTNHIWAMQYTGASLDEPFAFREVFANVGLLAPNCVAAFEGSHVALTSNDVVVHDLNQVTSVVDKRARRWLFGKLDPTNYAHSYIVANHRQREAWICFPESGQIYPNLALVWNWSNNSLSVRELGGAKAHAAYGVVSQGTSDTFDGAIGTFDSDTDEFDVSRFNPAQGGMLIADHLNVELLQADAGYLMDTQQYTARVVREAVPLGDPAQWKRVTRLWPRVVGVAGDTIQFSVGVRERENDTVKWSLPQTFTIGTDVWCDFRTTGRVVDWRMEHTSAHSMRLNGLDIEFDPAGLY